MKKKISALVLAAGMVMGMGGYGTVSYLRDTDTVKADVNIITGKIDCEITWNEDEWQFADGVNYLEYENQDETLNDGHRIVKPGDEVYRTARITNTGNINAVIESIEGISPADGIGIDIVETTGAEKLYKDSYVDVKVKMTVSPHIEEMGKKFTMEGNDVLKVTLSQDNIPEDLEFDEE